MKVNTRTNYLSKIATVRFLPGRGPRPPTPEVAAAGGATRVRRGKVYKKYVGGDGWDAVADGRRHDSRHTCDVSGGYTLVFITAVRVHGTRTAPASRAASRGSQSRYTRTPLVMLCPGRPLAHSLGLGPAHAAWMRTLRDRPPRCAPSRLVSYSSAQRPAQSVARRSPSERLTQTSPSRSARARPARRSAPARRTCSPHLLAARERARSSARSSEGDPSSEGGGP